MAKVEEIEEISQVSGGGRRQEMAKIGGIEEISQIPAQAESRSVGKRKELPEYMTA